MSHFSDTPEEEFRRFHGDVHEGSTQWYNVMDCEKPCRNWCRYLISGDEEDMRDGLPAVCGVAGAKVYVQCWGGDDIRNSTIEAYCSECVAASERYRREQRSREEGANLEHPKPPQSRGRSRLSSPPEWKNRRTTMPHVYCFIEETTLEGDYGEVEGVRAKCQQCGHTTESRGTSDGSKRRCLALMRDQCPAGENNFYEEDTGH
jgi:hypothetical protein